MTANTNNKVGAAPQVAPGTAPSPLPVALAVGTDVEVRSRFDRRWARGFAVAAASPDAYQVRRMSDGSVLPAWFPRDEIRQTSGG